MAAERSMPDAVEGGDGAQGERVRLPGIDEALPAGERLRWSGAPDAGVVARRVLHARKLALYFAGLALATLAVQWPIGGARVALAGAATVVGMGAVVLLFVRVYAVLIARTTLYALTDRRVILRVGVALPTVINIPLDQITSVDLRRQRRGPPACAGVGDVVLTLAGDTRIAWLLLWPHCRPWYVTRPRPAFRALCDAGSAGRALADVVRAAQEARSAPNRGDQRDASAHAAERAGVMRTPARGLPPEAVGTYNPPVLDRSRAAKASRRIRG